MKLTIILLVIQSMLITACSTNNDDWGDIASLAEMDISSEAVDCKKLLSATVEREYGFDQTYSENVLDYEYETGRRFSQCRPEIEVKRVKFCSDRVFTAVSYFTGKYADSDPSRLFFANCKSELNSELTKIKYTYELPSNEIRFLTLNDAGEMIDPSSIDKISFKSTVNGALWELTLHTNDKRYTLYFGQKEDWEKTKRDFAILASKSDADTL